MEQNETPKAKPVRAKKQPAAKAPSYAEGYEKGKQDALNLIREKTNTMVTNERLRGRSNFAQVLRRLGTAIESAVREANAEGNQQRSA